MYVNDEIEMKQNNIKISFLYFVHCVSGWAAEIASSQHSICPKP